MPSLTNPVLLYCRTVILISGGVPKTCVSQIEDQMFSQCKYAAFSISKIQTNPAKTSHCPSSLKKIFFPYFHFV